MPIPTDAVLRLGPGGSFVDLYVADESRTRLERAELQPTEDTFGENAQGGGRGGWGGAFAREQADDAYAPSAGSDARGSHAERAIDSVRVSARASKAAAMLLAETLLAHQGESTKGVSCTIAWFARKPAAPASGVPGRGLRSTFASSARAQSGARRWNQVPYEPHSEATQDSETDPRPARALGLFPDDAGARRRARREQGHGLRARRSAHPQGRPQARAEQGTLFVDR